MAHVRNLLRRHFDNYGGWFGDFQQDKPYLRSNPMSEGPSRPNGGRAEEEQGESGTSSKETDDWLQLGIGRPSASTMDHPTTSTRQAQTPTELELFSLRPPPPPPLPPVVATPMAVIPRPMPWGLWNQNQMMGAARPIHPMQYGYRQLPSLPESSAHPVGEMRVVSPPRRPQAGVWFLLQAAPNQVREPFLPQIPRSFLRIKDGGMTVRLLMKYLVRKLGLHDESEVEITCRGQLLHPILALQHVRDNIWCSRATTELLPESPAADNVMILEYSRSSM